KIATDLGEGAVPVVTVQAQVEANGDDGAAIGPTADQAASLP
ncbi:MAG: hypothetical protein RLZZ440_1340, partial [Planctomycetota bacterium]